MADKNISIGEAFKFAWGSYKSNIGYFIKILLIVIVIYTALGATSLFTTRDTSSLPGSIIGLVNSILEIVISIGMIKISLTFVRGEKPLLSDLFSSYRLFFNFVISSIINSLIIILGLILFIVPGVILFLKFSQFVYYVVDKKSGPIQALKESSKLTQGAKWELLGFEGSAFVINLLGLMFFFVGILITAPITQLARAHVYQQLLDNNEPTENKAAIPTPIPTPAPTLESTFKPPLKTGPVSKPTS